MNIEPLITVIIPSYNREKTIVRAVESVLNQTYKNIELIIVDDCSSDGTEEKVKKINDDRVIFIKHEKNQGACAARNTGLAHARGEYIAFQDSDDYWIENKLEKQIKALVESDADVCFCKMLDLGYSKEHSLYTPDFLQEGIIPYTVLYEKASVGTQSIFAKKSVFDEHKFDVKVKKAQDIDWMLRAGENHSFYFIDEILVVRFLQEDSITMGGDEKSLIAHEYFLKKYAEKCKSDSKFYIARLKIVVRIKSRLNKSSTEELQKIYELTHNKKDLAKLFLSKIGILNFVYKYARKKAHNQIVKRNEEIMESDSYQKLLADMKVVFDFER